MADFTHILFDFGNILIDIDLPRAEDNVHALLRNKNRELAYQEVEPILHRYETGQLETEGFLHSMLEYCEEGTTRDQLIEAWNSVLVGIPAYRLTMLEQLKEHFTVLMLSNTNALNIEWVHSYLTTQGIRDFERTYFHDVYYSFLIGERKPNAAAWKFVLQDAFISAEKTLFIDDLAENIAAAQALGFQTLHSPAEDEISETLKVMGIY